MKIRLIAFIFSWIGCLGLLLAQQSSNKLLWKTTEENTVLLKWYGPEIYTSEDVNIYRKPVNADDSSWEKLNAQPIKILDEVPDALPNSEELLYAETVKKGVDEEAKGIFSLLILLKSFESTPFARFLGVYFEDKTATVGQTYLYKTRLIKRNGTEVDFAFTAPVTVGNPLPFEPPQKIETDGVNDNITFKWEVESDRYWGVNIYRSEERNGSFELINNPPILISRIERQDSTMGYPDVFYTDDSLEINKNYYYYLEARGFFADSSERSEIMEVLVRDEIPPVPVQDLSFIQPDDQDLEIVLSWKKSTDTDIAGYYLQRKVTGDFITVSPLISADATTYSHRVPRTESYLFRILSEDNAGNQTAGNDIIVRVNDNTPPVAPQNLKTEGKRGAIMLSWDANPEPDVMGYYVYRIESGYRDRLMLLLNADFITETSFIDSLPEIAKNKFVYRVAAIDSSYNIGPKSELSEASMPDVTPPIRPHIQRAYLAENTIKIEWLPNLDVDIAGYELYRNSDRDTSTWNPLHNQPMLDTSITEFIDANLEAGITYGYQLFALDFDGNKSAPSIVRTASTLPPILQISPAPDLSLKYDKKKNTVKIKWKQTQNDAITEILIFRKEGTGRYVPISTSLTKEKEYTDKYLTPEKNYSYQLRTYYKDGKITRSEPVEITTQ